MSLSPCIFCGVRPASSPEHIVLDSLGGQRTTKGLLCTPCNNRFGGTIDAELSQALGFFSTVTGCFRGDGRPVADVVVNEQGSDREVIVSHGAKVRPTREVELRFLGVDGQEETKLFNRLVPTNIAGFVASLASKLNVSEEDVHLSLVATTGTTTETEISGGFGGPGQFRSVAKMGLAALCKCNVLETTGEVDDIATWVNGGPTPWPHVLDPTAGPVVRDALSTSIGQHVLWVFSSNTGKCEALFAAFGCIVYRVTMPTTPSTFTGIVHIVDPVAQQHEVRVPTALPALQPFETVVLDGAYGEAAINELMTWVRSEGQRAILSTEIAMIFDDFQKEGKEFIDEADATIISEKLVARLQGGKPREEVLDTSDLMEMIRVQLRRRQSQSS